MKVRLRPVSNERQIVYVVQEYPPRTQTFVWREIEQIRASGRNILVYALRTEKVQNAKLDDVYSFRDSLKPSMLIMWFRVALLLAFGGRRALTIVRLPPAGIKSKARQLYATAHAMSLICIAYHRSSKPRLHFHAHFLGRCLDVASIAKALDPHISISATGHAAEVTSPSSAVRLARLVAGLDCVACASTAVAHSLQALTGRRDIRVVRCGIRKSGTSSTTWSPRPALRILSVGRLVPKKGFDDCLHAAAKLMDRGFDFHWTFIGEGPEKAALQQLANYLGVHNVVTWDGYRTAAEVHDRMAEHSDIFVLPCKVAPNGDHDGIPVVLMEAMAAGIPVISTDVGGIGELVIHDVTGFVIKQSCPDDLCEQIVKAVGDASVTGAIVENGRRKIQAEFDLEHEAAVLTRLIDRVSTGPSIDSVHTRWSI